MKQDDFPQEAARLRPMLIAIATGIVGDSDEAEDIVQDVLLKLWTICPKLQVPFDTLASVITRNMARSCIRRRHPVSDIDGMDISSEDSTSEDKEPLDYIMRCIDTLPTFQQLVIRLRHIDGMEYATIAGITGSNESAVRKAVSRARMSIRDKYMKDKNR